jgi:hypothetical protein
MSSPSASLLLKFRTKDTSLGVTRDTVKKMAALHDLSETQVVHMALSRMAKEDLPSYEADDGPLKGADIRAIQQVAAVRLPTGKLLSKKSLL